jgi:type I restriction enzyme S subunit
MAVELSVKQIKDGWQVVKFGEIAKEVKSTTKDPHGEGLEFYVGLEHLEPQSLRIVHKGIIAEDNPSFTRRFSSGQILFGKRRCYQKKAAVADFEGICSGDIIVMDAIPKKIIPGLLPFIIQSAQFFNWAEKTSSGSLSPRTKWKSLAEYECPLPPIERQKEIFEVLEKIELCNQNIFRCERSAEALYKKLLLNIFPNFFEKYSKLYQKLPANWNEFELGRLLASAPESGYSANELPTKSEWHVLNLNCLSKSGFVNNGYKSITKEDFSLGKEVMKGDFLISRSNTKELVGAVGIYSKNDKRAIFPDTMWRLNLKSDLILPEFLEGYLLSPYGRRQLVRLAAGTSGSMVKINKQSLKKLPVPVPSLDAQKQIVSVISSLKDSWQKLVHQRNNYLKLRQSIFNTGDFL